MKNHGKEMVGGGGGGDWIALPRGRGALVGARGADGMTWAWRGSAFVLALAVAWWGWVALRPLEKAGPAEAQAIPEIARMVEVAPGMGERGALIESLGRENLFAADRKEWPKRMPRNADAHAAEQASKGTEAGVEPTPPIAAGNGVGTASASAASGPRATVTPRESLPEDVKKALGALELKAVLRDGAGEGIAMITFVHSAARPASLAYRAGDEFSEETNPQARWRVEAVEVSRRRVVLSRSGVVMALPLYRGLGDGPPGLGTGPGTLGAHEPGEVVIEGRTRDEVVLDLRSKGLSENEITAVMSELDRQLDATGESPVKALTEIVAPSAEAGAEKAQGVRRTPPAGMEAVLKMMAEQSAQVTAKAKDAPTKTPTQSNSSAPKPKE